MVGFGVARVASVGRPLLSRVAGVSYLVSVGVSSQRVLLRDCVGRSSPRVLLRDEVEGTSPRNLLRDGVGVTSTRVLLRDGAREISPRVLLCDAVLLAPALGLAGTLSPPLAATSLLL